MSCSASNPPVLAEPRPRLPRACCCCYTLRTGVIILSALGVRFMYVRVGIALYVGHMKRSGHHYLKNMLVSVI